MTSTATVVRLVGRDKGTPGPGSYNLPSDFGKAPSYTIKHKYPEKLNTNKAGYENLPNTIGTGKKYSLSSRHKERDYNLVPGPTYVPPKLGANAPAHAFHMRAPDEKSGVVSPGPGKYDTSPGIGTGAPKYTLKARKFIAEEGFPEGPGTGKYLPDYEKVMPTRPKTGIGIKTKEAKRAATPGPGQYTIDRSPPSKAAAFHIKQHELKKDNYVGPGKYDTSVPLGAEVPRYTIRPKTELRNDPIRAPYQKIPEKFGKEGPKYSLSSKHKELERAQTPGPSYVPPPFGSDGKKYSVTSRRAEIKNANAQPGPGAGKYYLRPATAGPSFTIKQRKYPPNDGVIDGPGGGKYMPDYEKVLPTRPKTSILEKHEPRPKDPLPGYVDLGTTFTGPKYTIGLREELTITSGTT